MVGFRFSICIILEPKSWIVSNNLDTLSNKIRVDSWYKFFCKGKRALRDHSFSYVKTMRNKTLKCLDANEVGCKWNADTLMELAMNTE